MEEIADIVEKNADIKQIYETNEEFKRAEEDDNNKC